MCAQNHHHRPSAAIERMLDGQQPEVGQQHKLANSIESLAAHVRQHKPPAQVEPKQRQREAADSEMPPPPPPDHNQRPLLRQQTCSPIQTYGSLEQRANYSLVCAACAQQLAQSHLFERTFVLRPCAHLDPELPGQFLSSLASGKQADHCCTGAGAAQPPRVQAPARRPLIERLAKRIPGFGILLALCASTCLGTAGMLVKMIHSVHGIQVAVLRAAIQFSIYSAIMVYKRTPIMPPDRRELLPVFGRACLGATSITLSYYSLKLIPLGDATTIRFSLPIWTLIIGYLLLGESCNILKVGAVATSMLGVLLIAKPDECTWLWRLLLDSAFDWRPSGGGVAPAATELPAPDDWPLEVHQQTIAPPPNEHQFRGSMLALTSSICLSMSLISLRLCKRTPAELTILWLSIMSLALGTGVLVAMDEWRLPNNLSDWLFVLLNGLCGALGQWFITMALKVEQSGVIALARTFDIEVAFFYSAFLLHEVIRATSIVGAVLVSLGVVVVVVPKWFRLGAEGTQEEEQQEQEEEDKRSADAGPLAPSGQNPAAAGENFGQVDRVNGQRGNNKIEANNIILDANKSPVAAAAAAIDVDNNNNNNNNNNDDNNYQAKS